LAALPNRAAPAHAGVWTPNYNTHRDGLALLFHGGVLRDLNGLLTLTTASQQRLGFTGLGSADSTVRRRHQIGDRGYLSGLSGLDDNA
jgi:hypothetical protein